MSRLLSRQCGWALAISAALAGSAAQAQDLTIQGFGAPGQQDTSGALLFHGNYCGPGNRGWNVPPVDALDAACARHDACTPDGALPACGCNHRLQFEATAISQNPYQPDDLRALAGLVAVGATLLPCRPGT